eukprot:g9679.t1
MSTLVLFCILVWPSCQACQGFKCERGHPAFGARPKRKAHKASALQTLQSDSDYAFEINEDGVWNTYFLPGATIIDKRTVNYGINDKYYLMAKDTTDYSNAANFHKVALAGKTIITTVNLNGAGCGCNVNFFLVNMPASSPGQYGDYYCDANCVGGNCCAEFDINDARSAPEPRGRPRRRGEALSETKRGAPQLHVLRHHLDCNSFTICIRQ